MNRKLDYFKDADLLGAPFFCGYMFGCEFYESDLKYMNPIKSHPLYRIVTGKTHGIQNLAKLSKTQCLQRTFSQIIFYEQFLNNPDCSPNVKKFLYFLIGDYLTDINLCGASEIFIQRRPLIEKWMEKCR